MTIPAQSTEACNDWCGPGSHHMPPCCVTSLPVIAACCGDCDGRSAAEPCRVYSHGADGWHCAVQGDHEQHTNAAGDVTW